MSTISTEQMKQALAKSGVTLVPAPVEKSKFSLADFFADFGSGAVATVEEAVVGTANFFERDGVRYAYNRAVAKGLISQEQMTCSDSGI